ncbi:MAG: cytochrome P450 [Bacteroidota bacterium]
MPTINNLPDDAGFKTDFCYSKPVPTLVGSSTGAPSEIARWVLDRNHILYANETHAPWKIHSLAEKLTGKKSKINYPLLKMTDAFIYGAESIVMFWEKRCLPQDRLLPEDDEQLDKMLDLYYLFTDDFFAGMVEKYFYNMLLTSKKVAGKVLKRAVPPGEKEFFSLGFSGIKKKLTRTYELQENNTDECIAEIRKVFNKVNQLLADGRKYLTGDAFTLADLAFAAVAAPMILPEEYGGELPRINEVPDTYRTHITELRATPAGQFVFMLYQANRPSMLPQSEIPSAPGFMKKGIDRLLIKLKKKQYKTFYFLQKNFPVLKIPFVKILLVNRNSLLMDLMQRDNDFTVEEINSKKMSDQKGAFYLGMDRNNPQFNRERDFVMKATKRDDMIMIQNFVRSSSEEITRNASRYGKIDVANSLCKVVLVRLLDYYFGVPSENERDMKRWMRAIFYDLFLNFFSKKEFFEAALQASEERKELLLKIIAKRKQEMKDGKTLDDNLLNRLIILSHENGYEWVDDDVLQRNIGGLLTGIFETTNKAAVLILDELLNRPDAMQHAIEVSQQYDVKKMYGIVNEALRFNPAQPGVIRYCKTEQSLTGGGQKNYRIPAKRKVFALTSGAMFDPEAFPDPRTFIPNRNAVYMNYGYALHECYGKYINAVTLSEFTMAVLRLKNVRREKGITGNGTGIVQQSFPNNFVLCFDIPETAW